MLLLHELICTATLPPGLASCAFARHCSHSCAWSSAGEAMNACRVTPGYDSHGKKLVRYITELELVTTYGPKRGVRLAVATPIQPRSTWYLATPCRWPTSAPRRSTRSIACVTGSSTSTNPSNMRWAAQTTRCAPSGRLYATVRWCRWSTLSACWWARLPPALCWHHPPPHRPHPRRRAEKIGLDRPPTCPTNAASKEWVAWVAAPRWVRSWLCPWAQLQRFWQRWSTSAPPPESPRSLPTLHAHSV